MNLRGKYIEINENNVEYIINLLYSKGYKWSITGNNDLEIVLLNYKHYINKDKKSYMRFAYNSFFVFDINPPNNQEYYNINKYLREEKLKRILKSNQLPKINYDSR